jgi:hypothetical protein
VTRKAAWKSGTERVFCAVLVVDWEGSDWETLLKLVWVDGLRWSYDGEWWRRKTGELQACRLVEYCGKGYLIEKRFPVLGCLGTLVGWKWQETWGAWLRSWMVGCPFYPGLGALVDLWAGLLGSPLGEDRRGWP